jgi:hypothetical protein
MPTRARTVGDLERAKKRLWRGILRASEVLEDPDSGVALRAIHALAQACGVYVRLFEAAELEERVAALEQALLQHQGPLGLRRVKP